MQRDFADIKIKAVLLATLVLCLIVVLFEMYAEVVVLACATFLWFKIRRKYFRKQAMYWFSVNWTIRLLC